ncbi:MAG: hypothetical protein CMJ32_04470 [Phycisphaerae bacterium]|nr:hypothetical protein [Phycisphaerae bacterium]MBC23153.1 hypothetical protein [Phycisphaerae bacterium]
MKTVILLTSMLLATASPCTAVTQDQAVSVQNLAEQYVEAGLSPGIAIGVLDSGRVRTYCAGTLEAGSSTPVTENTIFEIGSITKVFTTVIAHRLEQQGELSLSDPVSMHLPDHVDMKMFDGNRIMLWHLATHTSGFPKMPNNFQSADPRNPYECYTDETLYEYLADTGPDRAPGSEWRYSNLGIAILGHALELNQDADYEELVQKHILKPLKMSSTSCMPRDKDAGRVATGHKGLNPTSQWDINGPMAAAGDLNSSLKDMMRFARAAMARSNTPLQHSIRACQVPRVKGKYHPLGLGWMVSNSGQTIFHGGQTGGFKSNLILMPERERAVVILLNSSPGPGMDVLSKHILAPDLVGPDNLPASMAADYTPRVPVNIDEYAGTYVNSSGPRFVVENRDGVLFAKLDDQQFFAFRPIDKDLFACRTVDAKLRFVRDPQGRSRTLVLLQNGRGTAYNRQ